MDPPDDPHQSTWQRFLGGKTSAQRFMLALGALSGAVLAIGGVIAGGAAMLDDEGSPGPGPASGKVQTVRSQTSQADGYVRFLLQTAGFAPVQLDHKVLASQGDGGEFRLEYNCASTRGCSVVRLETPSDIPAQIAGGVWYQGCWSVEKDGAGYGAEHLDIELRKRGDLCPP